MYIYVLKHLDDNNSEVIFYVGKSNNPTGREREHIYSSKNGHEDKYVYIRALESQKTPWWLETVIETTPSRGLPHDYERYYVIYFARQNCPLTNMKHGDFHEAENIRKQIENNSINSVEDVRDDRIKAEDLKKSMAFVKKAKQADLFQQKAKKKHNRDLFKTRKNNLKLMQEKFGKTEFSIMALSSDIIEFDTHICADRYKPEWSFKIEAKLGLPNRWMDQERNNLKGDESFKKVILKKEHDDKWMDGTLTLKDFEGHSFEKTNIKNTMITLIGIQEYKKWMLIFFNSGIIRGDIGKIYKILSKDRLNQLLENRKNSEEYQSFFPIREEYSEIRDMDIIQAKENLPFITSGDTGYAHYSNNLTEIEYNRKMCLLWLCYLSNGVVNFSRKVKKNYKLITPYTNFGESKPISDRLARTIENKFKLPLYSFDENRDFMFIDH